ncbi:hypothetical protein LLH06_06170 [Mucilaginibacter daejeonensis]|uniref:hypothetical protein n=1 Tax=Mucilaginibacter daejeonensis TaxID=398049 RepID=UPI001D1767CC|nr:hypothetical protein [Mucilaginibacter daejeonensis]UEG54545.1 hypothetical protein LLH06_06170 [Mucilaginibacter daejeonensis]
MGLHARLISNILPPYAVDMPVYDPTDPTVWNYTRYADIYIEITDENNELVYGSNVSVKYNEVINGQLDTTEYSQVMTGARAQIRYQQPIEGVNGYGNSYTFAIFLTGEIVQPGAGDVPTAPITDPSLQITSVTIDQKESGMGAADGKITINAVSSYGYIQYKINDGPWQDSANFSGLAGGTYTAYIRDAYNGGRQMIFTVETVIDLLVDDPTIDLGNGRLSRWSAAFNPIVFSYQRRDMSITNITADAFWAKTTFAVNGTLSSGSVALAAKDKVYVNAGAYNGVYDVESVDISNRTFTIDQPYVSSTNHTGFTNINKLRPYYQICTKIAYQDKLTGINSTITCTHRPNQKGLTQADLSSFLQSLLRAKDSSDGSQVNYRDDDLSASYTVSYAETWYDTATGKDVPPSYINIQHPYYVTYSARQLGDAYGGNMAAYVPFKTVDAPSKRARWITDLTEPAYSVGYPFDIGFIYSENLAGLDLYAEMTLLDINRQPLADSLRTTYLLKEDRSFLLQQDSSKFVIYRSPVSSGTVTTGLAQHIGLNRLKIDTELNDEVHYLDLEIKYKDSAGVTHTVTQKQTVRVDHTGDENSVYLRWIGLNGSWNYYRFVYNQEVTLDVQNAVIVKNHILNWADQDSMEDVISKSAGLKMKVMAEDLSVSDINGLRSIKFSPKVQMLMARNPAKWQTIVINSATFAEYETRNGQAPFSITFNLPGINIQTQ